MAMDRWLEIEDDKIILFEENDGWTYLKRGPERTQSQVYLIKLRESTYNKELRAELSYTPDLSPNHMIDMGVSKELAEKLKRFQP
jgi:hypothetical protein